MTRKKDVLYTTIRNVESGRTHIPRRKGRGKKKKKGKVNAVSTKEDRKTKQKRYLDENHRLMYVGKTIKK